MQWVALVAAEDPDKDTGGVLVFGLVSVIVTAVVIREGVLLALAVDEIMENDGSVCSKYVLAPKMLCTKDFESREEAPNAPY